MEVENLIFADLGESFNNKYLFTFNFTEEFTKEVAG
jgi:hypothetical protein